MLLLCPRCATLVVMVDFSTQLDFIDLNYMIFFQNVLFYFLEKNLSKSKFIFSRIFFIIILCIYFTT